MHNFVKIMPNEGLYLLLFIMHFNIMQTLFLPFPIKMSLTLCLRRGKEVE